MSFPWQCCQLFPFFSNILEMPGGVVSGILRDAQEGNQEAAVRKLAQARTSDLPPVQRRCLGTEGRAASLPPIPYPGGNHPEG
jgi:hypothetical protein